MKIIRAEKLISGLGGEKERWTNVSQSERYHVGRTVIDMCDCNNNVQRFCDEDLANNVFLLHELMNDLFNTNTWRGVAWRGVAWRGVAWRGVAWRGVAWRGVAWRGVAWRGVAWRGVACGF